MDFYKNMLSWLAHIMNTQSTLVAKYIISPLGQNLHYQIKFCPILNYYTIVSYTHKANSQASKPVDILN